MNCFCCWEPTEFDSHRYAVKFWRCVNAACIISQLGYLIPDVAGLEHPERPEWTQYYKTA